MERDGLIKIHPKDRTYIKEHSLDEGLREAIHDWEARSGSYLGPRTRVWLLAEILSGEAFYIRSGIKPADIRKTTLEVLPAYLDAEITGDRIKPFGAELAHALGSGAQVLSRSTPFGELETQSAEPNAEVYLDDEYVGTAGKIYIAVANTYKGEMRFSGQLLCEEVVVIIEQRSTHFAC